MESSYLAPQEGSTLLTVVQWVIFLVIAVCAYKLLNSNISKALWKGLQGVGSVAQWSLSSPWAFLLSALIGLLVYIASGPIGKRLFGFRESATKEYGGDSTATSGKGDEGAKKPDERAKGDGDRPEPASILEELGEEQRNAARDIYEGLAEMEQFTVDQKITGEQLYDLIQDHLRATNATQNRNMFDDLQLRDVDTGYDKLRALMEKIDKDPNAREAWKKTIKTQVNATAADMQRNFESNKNAGTPIKDVEGLKRLYKPENIMRMYMASRSPDFAKEHIDFVEAFSKITIDGRPLEDMFKDTPLMEFERRIGLSENSKGAEVESDADAREDATKKAAEEAAEHARSEKARGEGREGKGGIEPKR